MGEGAIWWRKVCLDIPFSSHSYFSNLFYPACPSGISPRATVRFMSQLCGRTYHHLKRQRLTSQKCQFKVLSSFTILFSPWVSSTWGKHQWHQHLRQRMKTQNAGEGKESTKRAWLEDIRVRPQKAEYSWPSVITRGSLSSLMLATTVVPFWSLEASCIFQWLPPNNI